MSSLGFRLAAILAFAMLAAHAPIPLPPHSASAATCLSCIDWSDNIARIALKVERILHDDYILLDLERGFVGMKDNYQTLDRLLRRAEARIKVRPSYTEDQAVEIGRAIHDLLEEEGFRYREFAGHEQFLLGNVVFGYQLARRELDCVSYAILGLGIAEHLGLPVRGIHMPGHFSLRWMLEGGASFNLELSIPARCDDAFYMRWREIPPKAVHDGVYLRNLQRREIIAQQLYSLGLIWEKRRNLEMASSALENALKLSPLFPDALNLRGLIRKKEGRGGEALHDFDLALALDPGFVEARFNRESLLTQ